MPRPKPTRNASRASRSSGVRAAATRARRAKVVWLALLASMTTVGGLLLVVEDRPAPRLDGHSFISLVAASGGGPSGVESVVRTRNPLRDAEDGWGAIVIHHSASPVGSPASIAAQHEARNFKGLGHHFVIGNGSGMADGELHVGFRWLDQLPGAHAGGPDGDWHNLHSISICLVGDGDRRTFTRAQMRTLTQLVNTLRRELRIPLDRVLLHSAVAPTSDPGRLFPTAAFYDGLSLGL